VLVRAGRGCRTEDCTRGWFHCKRRHGHVEADWDLVGIDGGDHDVRRALDHGRRVTTVTVWVQVVLFPQQSVTCHVCVTAAFPQLTALVTVLNTVIVTLVPQQLLTTVGRSNVQPEPGASLKTVPASLGPYHAAVP